MVINDSPVGTCIIVASHYINLLFSNAPYLTAEDSNNVLHTKCKITQFILHILFAIVSQGTHSALESKYIFTTEL